MKQVHKLKEMNRKLEDALKQIDKLTRDHAGPNSSKIQIIIENALDKTGNHK